MDSPEAEYYEKFGEISGILMYKDFLEYWDDVETFPARPDDLVIATYPKSGKLLPGQGCFSPRNYKPILSSKY
jgi:estrone sulfotransferase